MSSSFVTIKTFDNPALANLAKTKLQDAGIVCLLHNELYVGMDLFLSNAVGGIRLVVNEEDSKEATELLDFRDSNETSELTCNVCGSHDLMLLNTFPTVWSWFVVLWSFLMFTYPPGAKKVYHCINCKSEFEFEEVN